MSRAWIAAIGFCAAVGGTAAVAVGSGSTVKPLPQSFCSPVLHGPADPQLLIVSDFPLRFFDHKDKTLNFQQAIKYVLKQRHYKAGRFSVGYQACDDSSPQQGIGAFSKCASNAKAYAQDASVVGVIGTWSSVCAGTELPALNRASGGPLVLISPSNTNDGLTHASAGTEPGEPGRYYPTGRRNFARLISPDDAQGVAEAILAKQLGMKRIFILDDREGYGLDVASAFRASARKIGLAIAGNSSWKPDQTKFNSLAAKVAKASPDAVLLGGYACAPCGELIKGLRHTLGAKVTLIGPDGFGDPESLVPTAGSALEGMYYSIPGQPLSDLPAAGRKIEKLFGPPGLGSGGPSYAAQTVAVLLDAIAASNGTRAFITSHVLKAHVHNGLIGSFGFDKNGDPTFNPIMIFRVHGGKGTLDRVVRVPTSLLP